MLRWDAATMSTGVDEVDRQHQELIARLNDLFDHMRRGEAGGRIHGLLDFIARYSQWHFDTEEACMARANCPVACANRDAHREFIRVFTILRARLERDGATPTLIIEVQRQLSGWLKHHIVRVDAALRDCVLEKSA